MRFRPGPLRRAAVFAAVFVAARVVYYALFAGAGYGGTVLLPLPLVTLPAPFTGVRLLGPITSGGLAAAALSAVPFAVVILFFGMLNALFDARPWLAFAARHGPATSLARALVIAWQTVPALGAALGNARRAARLRGERPGVSALVPVLEGAIERAVALAGSLELRGFAATARVLGGCERPVEITQAVLCRAGWSLRIPALSLEPGTLTVLTGPTGAGKSSVLDALSGLFQHVDGGQQSGAVLIGGVERASVPPRETAGFVAAVSQRVRLSFVGETVEEEIGAALALRGVASAIVAARVREIAARLGILQLVERPISALSAGEAELVALAAAMVENPSLLLVDEPLAELDSVARPRVVAALGALAHEAGVCVVVAEHRGAWFSGVADGWLAIHSGELQRADAAGVGADATGTRFSEPDPLIRNRIRFRIGGSGSENHTIAAAPGPAAATAPPVAELTQVTVRHGSRLAVDGVSLDLFPGEIVALTGANGAGKSSLLTEFALPTAPRRVFVGGNDVHIMTRRARHAAVTLVPEALEDLFVTDSVSAECRRADRLSARLRRAGRPGHPRTLDRFGALLGIDARLLADVHPRDLSGGQRVCLAIALQLAADPAVLLVDEPVRGLDAQARDELATALERAADAGTAVLFATHEQEFAVTLAGRTLALETGRLSHAVELAS